MPSNAAYWQGRRLQLLNQMETDEKKLNAKLAKIYDAQETLLKREIASYYAQYGVNNVVEYRRLLDSLSASDRRLLMQRMEDFAKKYPQYAHLMPVRESIYKLDRLEGLQYSIWLQQMEIGAIDQAQMTAHFNAYAQKAANLAAEELGFGSNFYAINAQVVTATVGASWAQGQNFSQRIWANRNALASYLSDDLAKGFARGLKYEDMAKLLTTRFANVSKRDAMRLIYTEGTFIFNEAQAQVHEQQFQYYQLSTITDPKTCEVCKGVERAQKIEPMPFESRKPGVNFPPLHPNCRCSTLVVVPDWDAWIEEYVAKHGGDYIQERDRPDLNYLHPDKIHRMTKNQGAKPLPKELRVGDLLVRAGYTVAFIKPINKFREKTADLYLDGTMFEMKVPEKYNEKTVKNQFKKSVGKGTSHLIISTTENNASIDDIARDVQRLFDDGQFSDIDHVMIIDGDGIIRELFRQ